MSDEQRRQLFEHSKRRELFRYSNPDEYQRRLATERRYATTYKSRVEFDKLIEKTTWAPVCANVVENFGLNDLKRLAGAFGLNIRGKSKKEICEMLNRDY
jgi:hypothetical protein